MPRNIETAIIAVAVNSAYAPGRQALQPANEHQVDYVSAHEQQHDFVRSRAGCPSSRASASDDGRGDLMDDTVAKPQCDALTPRDVVASTRKVDTTNEAASSTLLTPIREHYQKCAANGRVVFVVS
jgi:hypothetical protein